MKPQGTVLSLASQAGLSFSRSFQQSQGICVVSVTSDTECKETGQPFPSVLDGDRRLELLSVKTSGL